jgi:hypothetical protein
MIYLLPLAAITNILTRGNALEYVFGVIVLTRFIESIPFWRFRDRVLEFSKPAAEIAIAVKSEG